MARRLLRLQGRGSSASPAPWPWSSAEHEVTAFNAILPGAILTGMTARGFADPAIAGVWAKKSVLRRLGAPIDIARVALFLASDESAFVTGQAIAVDGGPTSADLTGIRRRPAHFRHPGRAARPGTQVFFKPCK